MNKTFSIKEAISFGWNTFKSNWKFWVIVTFLVGIGGVGTKTGSLGSIGEMFIPQNTSTQNTQYQQNQFENDYGPITFRTVDVARKSILGATDQQFTGTETEDEAGLKGPVLAVAVVIGIIFMLIVTAFAVMSALAGIVFKMGHINLRIDAARKNELDYKTLLNHVSFKKALRYLWATLLAGFITALGYVFFIIPGIYFSLRYMFVGFAVVDKDASVTESLKISSKLTKGVKFKLLGYLIIMGLLYFVGLLVLFAGVYVVNIVNSLAIAYIYMRLVDNKQEEKKQENTTDEVETEKKKELPPLPDQTETEENNNNMETSSEDQENLQAN